MTDKQKDRIRQMRADGCGYIKIPPETWELVQEELERRKRMDTRYSSAGIFFSKIKCSECGNWYGSKV